MRKVFYGVREVKTKNGKIGATIIKAYLEEMPKDSVKLTAANEKRIVWFDNAKRAKHFVYILTKDNIRR